MLRVKNDRMNSIEFFALLELRPLVHAFLLSALDTATVIRFIILVSN